MQVLLASALFVLTASVAEAQEAGETPMAEDAALEGDVTPEPESPPVYGGAGYRFGMTVAEARRACGSRLERIRRGLFRCLRVHDLLPLGGSTVLAFHDGVLSGIDVMIPLGRARPTSAPSIVLRRGSPEWVSQYRSLRDLLTARYGYSRPLTIAPDSCLADEAELARCVAEDRAHVASHFTPSNGARLSVHLVHVGDLGPHLRVRFFAPS
jgi:hypothetical protein